jgi:hypothetical protein
MNTHNQDLHIYTDKKVNKIFLIYEEIQMGSGAKSYMRKGFLIYVEMGKYLTIYEDAVSHVTLHPNPSEFFTYEENLISFLSVYTSSTSLIPLDAFKRTFC